MKSHEFHPPARSEFEEAVRFYETERPGWGRRFHDAVYYAIARICVFPDSGVLTRTGARKVVVLGFPYVVYYELMQNRIIVWAVMHGARHPDYWKSRRASSRP